MEKEYAQKLQALALQKEKVDEFHRKEAERLQTRRCDLDQQLENLQEKFRVRSRPCHRLRVVV